MAIEAGHTVGSAFTHGRPALITYLMAGFPDRATSGMSVRAAALCGADLIELGVPFADPLADGPAIVRAAGVARAQPGGFGLSQTLELARELTSSGNLPPIVLMSYLNPLLTYGFPRLAADAASAGVAGFIIPDLPPDSPIAAKWLAAAAGCGLQTVFLVAPTSTANRISVVTRTSQGFVYVVSSVGVTGERSELPPHLPALVERVRAAAGSGLPVAVGFGVSTPEQALAVARIADGVIVGSAIVKRQTDPHELGEFVSALASAVHGA